MCSAAQSFRGGRLGIREKLNRNSMYSTAAIVCMLVAAAVVIGLELRGNDGKPPAKSFFTVDDGKSWFADSSSKLPPFDHGGAQAVRCYVFKNSSGDFAGLLEKYSDDTRARLIQMAEHVPPIPVRDPPPVMVKKPGDKDWTNMAPEREGMMLMHNFANPDGSPMERVMP